MKRKKGKIRRALKKTTFRECGKCTVCCTALTVPSLEKPKQKECDHLCGDGSGCGIYKSRPTECREFQCLWTQGVLTESHRPDKIGIMAYYVDTQFGETLLMTETIPNAYDENSLAKDEIIKVAEGRKLAAILATYDGDAIVMVP